MIRFPFFLLIVFFLFSFTVANATEELINPNNLPSCPAKEIEKWNNCFGRRKKNGLSYSGEFQKNTMVSSKITFQIEKVLMLNLMAVGIQDK